MPISVPDPRQTLRLLHSLPHERIARDVAWAQREGSKSKIASRVCVYVANYHVLDGECTAKQSAAFLRDMMLIAHALRADGSPEELVAHHAMQGAQTVTQAAIDIALESGTAKELNARLNALLDAAGVTQEDVETAKALAPHGYMEVRDQLADVFIGIQNVMVPDILRRYQFDDFADQFEADSEAFTTFCEHGEEIANENTPLASQPQKRRNP